MVKRKRGGGEGGKEGEGREGRKGRGGGMEQRMAVGCIHPYLNSAE